MIRKDCKYYPCHNTLESCDLCYCPLYPCNNYNYGKYIDKEKKIWDCSKCTFIHDKKTIKVVKAVLISLMN